MDACLDEGTVVRFVEGDLATPDGARVEQHLAECARCRMWISELARATYAAGGDRYALGDVIGHGGMGEVRSARDTVIGRDIAMKVLRADKDGDHDLRARFLREARVQGRLEHPAI